MSPQRCGDITDTAKPLMRDQPSFKTAFQKASLHISMETNPRPKTTSLSLFENHFFSQTFPSYVHVNETSNHTFQRPLLLEFWSLLERGITL